MYTIISLAILLLAIFGIVIPINVSLTAYDCAHPESSILSIGTRSLINCPGSDETTKTIQSPVLVLSQQTTREIIAKTCHIVIDYLTLKCGMFSHISLVPKSLRTQIAYNLDSRSCNEIWINQAFNYGGVQIETKINSTTIYEATDRGFISSKGECTGATFTHDGETYTDAVRQVTIRITLKQETLKINLNSMNVISEEGYTTKFKFGYLAADHGKIIIWDTADLKPTCDSSHFYSLVYNGLSNITQTHSGMRILTVESTEKRFALALTSTIYVCSQQGYATEQKELIVILEPKMAHIPNLSDLSISDIDMYLNMNLKFVYMERHSRSQHMNLYAYFLKRYCIMNENQITHLLSLAHLNPEEFAWAYTKKPGFTAISRGEVIHLVKCHNVNVTLRNIPDCYMELPVMYHNESWFVKPISRLLVRIGTPVACTATTPTMYEINGMWVKIGGEIYFPKPPVILNATFDEKWEYEEISSIRNIGYLTESQIKEYQQSILGPMERQAISETFVRRVETNGYSSDQGLPFGQAVTTDSFAEDITSKILNKIYGIWDWVVRYLGAILGFTLLWDLMCVILAFIINFCLLYRKFGFSTMLFFSLWSTTAKHALYGNMTFRRFRGNNDKVPDNDDEPMNELEPMNQAESNSEVKKSMYPKLHNVEAKFHC